MNNMLAVSSNVDNLGGAFSSERLMYSLKMTLLGLGTVFAVLILLWIVLSLFKVFAYNIPEKKKKNKQMTTAIANAVTPEAAETPLEESAVCSESTDVDIAVITAAISAYIASDESANAEYTGGFRVVSFRRVRDKASWNMGN